jgi:hypothetical protein
MRIWSNPISASLALCFICVFGISATQAQTMSRPVHDIALKNGESTELSEVYWITKNCKSMLTRTPDVEVLEGPPGITAVVKPTSLVPRSHGCVNTVQGGKLIVTAKEVEDHGMGTMVLRVNYKSKNGNRQQSITVRLALVP